jgi:hypothetical protein
LFKSNSERPHANSPAAQHIKTNCQRLRTARISIVSGSALRLIVDGGDNVRALSSDEDAQVELL